jgi:hypothetical protein
MDFKKTILWKDGHRFAKLHKKFNRDKSKSWYQADFTNFILTGRMSKYQDKEWIEIQFIPCKFETYQKEKRTENNVSPPKQSKPEPTYEVPDSYIPELIDESDPPY